MSKKIPGFWRNPSATISITHSEGVLKGNTNKLLVDFDARETSIDQLVWEEPVVVHEVTASGVEQSWNYVVENGNRLRIRSADNEGDGIYRHECRYPFTVCGKTYSK